MNQAYSTINMRITKGAALSDSNFKGRSDCLAPRFTHKQNCATGQIIEMTCHVYPITYNDSCHHLSHY